MSLIALGSVITSPYQAIPTAYRLCCVGIGDSDVRGLGLSSLSATDFHSYLVGRRFSKRSRTGLGAALAGSVKVAPMKDICAFVNVLVRALLIR